MLVKISHLQCYVRASVFVGCCVRESARAWAHVCVSMCVRVRVRVRVRVSGGHVSHQPSPVFPVTWG
jgi:hypothetical protein